MHTLIETPNLGPVTISRSVIEFFSKQRADGDLAKSAEDVIRIVQSQEIEQLTTPSMVARRVSSNGDDPNAIEFWAHLGSSMVFTVVPRDGYRLVSLGIKHSMVGFTSDNDWSGAAFFKVVE
jgi:hypothetical protein